jgi:diguanylate cyclase (GGDEF)-like protein
MTELKEIFAARIFEGVDKEQLADSIADVRMVRKGAGEVLLSPIELNKEVFILLEGRLIICLEPDNFHPVATISPGDCVGELSIIDDRPPTAYVICADESRLAAIPRKTITTMFNKEPVLAVNLLSLLAERFRQNNEILITSLGLQRQYRDQAETDALTGIHNRTWMNEVFPRQLELSDRIGQNISLALIDIDHFKLVNDRHGHQTGDTALRHIAHIISSNLRATDLLARYGGEEIMVLMPATDIPTAMGICERLRLITENTPLLMSKGVNIPMTISIGLAQLFSGEGIEELIERADKALYRAKDSGRNKIVSSGRL